MNFDTSTYKKIAIIRLSALGDIVHALPAVTLLRKAFPHAEISWLAEPAGAKLLAHFPVVDEIVTLRLKKKGLFNKLKEIKRIRSTYGGTFDLILDFQGLLKSAVLARLLKGGLTVGFHQSNLKEPLARLFYKHSATAFDESRHVTRKNIHLADFGGRISALGTGQTEHGSPDWRPGDIRLGDLSPQEQEITAFLTRHGLEKKNFVILNVGGAWESKLLSREQNIAIAKGMAGKCPTVVLWGNEKEKRMAEAVCAETGAVPADFFGFGELIVFIAAARVLVTADTLALHLADLVQTPSVGVFGPTSPSRNGSLLKNSSAAYEKLSCGFCYKKKCDTIECIRKLDTTKINESIEKIYEEFS